MEPDNDNTQVSNDELSAFFATLWSQRRFVVIFTLIVAIVSLAYSYTIPPSYKAEVVVQIKAGSTGNKGGGVGALAGLASAAGLASGSDQTFEATMGTLRSKELMRHLIGTLKIEDILLGGSKSSLVDFLSAEGAPDPTRKLEMAREVFDKKVMAFTEDRKSGLSTISITWNDPEIAADWANQIVEMANNRLRDLAIDRARKNLDHLNSELPKESIVAIQQAIYRLIEEQVKAIMVATVDREFAVRVIDPAIKPLRRDSPKRRSIVVFAALAGLILASVTVLVRQRFFPGKPWQIGFLNSK